MKYNHSNIFFRTLNWVFRNISIKSKFHFFGILLKKDLRSDLPVVNSAHITFRQANEDDIGYIGSHPESLEYEAYKKRILNGHVCFCAIRDERVICYVWISFKTCGILFGTENEVEVMRLSDKQAYSYDLYAYKKNRKNNCASFLHDYTSIELKKMGKNERLSLIGPSFIASLKIAFKRGFVPQQMVYIYGFKGYKIVLRGTQRNNNKLRCWKRYFEEMYGNKILLLFFLFRIETITIGLIN